MGAGVYYDLLTYGLIKLGDPFGLHYLGKTELPTKNTPAISYHVASEPEDSNPDTELQSTLSKFWAIEELPTLKSLSTEDEQAELIFKITTRILQNAHFQIDIPLKSVTEHKKLGESLTVDKNRFFSLGKRLQQNHDLYTEYKKFVHEYISLEHATYVPLTLQNSRSENKYFIPHLPVFRRDRITTKLRVVFDTYCKTNFGFLLNDICLKGHQIHPDLYDILCRFRAFKYALIVDLEKMFRQIKINHKDVFLQNILWRDSSKEPLKCIELQTITYDMNCSPFLSTRVLNEIASTNKNLPLASDTVLTQTYVDDILTGCDSIESLEKLYSELKSLLEPAGFNLHKWGFNSQTFLRKMSQTQITEFDINLDQYCV